MPGSSIIDAVFCPRRRAAFTLVEMLVGMGIIVLLLAATLPALRGLSQAESRRGAVGNMMAALDRARMMAIADGLSTYVVFACKTPVDPQINADLWGRSYAIYEDGDNVSFIPAQKTPWIPLPKGMAFKVNETVTLPAGATNAHSALTSYLTQTPQAADPAFPLTNATGVGSAKLPYWKFDSTGLATVPVPVQTPSDQAQEYLRLLIFAGSIDANGNEISTQNANGAGNQQSARLEEIDVNPVTGRARYIIDPANNLSPPSSTPPPSP